MVTVHYTSAEKSLSKSIRSLEDINNLRGIGIQAIEIAPHITSKKEVEKTIKLLETLRYMLVS